MPLSTTRLGLRPTAPDLGICLLSAAVLLVELLLTRIFSVTLYYHLSFIVVSLAMLGLGLGGLTAQLETVRSRLNRGIVPWMSLAFAATAVLATLGAFNIRVRLDAGTEWGRLAVLYALCTLPFACAGAAIGLILSSNSERANRLYFFDLIGAALGCLLFIPLTNYVGAPTAVLVAAVIGATAAIAFSKNNLFAHRAATVVTWGLAALAVANVLFDWYDVRIAKGVVEEPFLAVKWNAFSRVEVAGKDPSFWQPQPVSIAGDSPELGSDFRWPLVPLRYDAGAATVISAFDGNSEHLGHLRYRVTAAPHLVRRLDDVLIIGPGGGTDVLAALSMGSSRIVGVEVNPLTVELMRTRFRTFSGRLYDGYPGVRILVDEGRSYVRASRERYDLIQASLVDTWAASAAGAHALTENSLYTVEAFGDYLEHLKPAGMVAFSRWFFEPPVEVLRVVDLAAEALQRRGATTPGAHIFVVRSKGAGGMPSLATVVVKRSEFDAAELDKLHSWAAEMGFLVTYSPRFAPSRTDPFQQMLAATVANDPGEAPFGVSLVDDDRPFFFSRLSIGAWLKSQASSRPLQVADMALGERSLLGAWTASLICLLGLLAAPFAGRHARGTVSGLSALKSRSMLWDAYFVCLGMGFIGVEVVLIQRLGLFLGYPTRALAVVMFTLLLSSGVGSLWAQRLERLGSVGRPLLLLCALLILAATILPPLSRSLLGAGVVCKILATIGLVAPLGFMMGVPFPSGIRHAARDATTSVPRAWAVNGVASVFGSCLTTAVAMSFGFTASLLCGAAAYAVAWVCLAKLATEPTASVVGTSPSGLPSLAGDLSAAGPPAGAIWALVALWLGLSVATTAKAKQEGEFLPPVGEPPANWSMVTASGIEFGAGWFDTERSRDGRTWRWMGAKGSVRLPNRHRDAKLSLKGWMPRAEQGPTPALHIFINGNLLADVETELAFTHQLLITNELQGQAEHFDVTLATDTTVRPARDPRDLGLCLDELTW